MAWVADPLTHIRLTPRQLEVLEHVRELGIVNSGDCGSVLEALRRKGLVIQHINNYPGYIAYMWTATEVR